MKRDDAEAALERFKNDVDGGLVIGKLNEALGLQLPGAKLLREEDDQTLDALDEQYKLYKSLADEHGKCNAKRTALVAEEFDDPELLSDTADSGDPDL